MDDRYNYKTQALADWTNVEMIAATRAQDVEIQIRGEDLGGKEAEFDCYYEGNCDTLYVPKMSYGAINIADVLQHKYFLNQQYLGIIKEALIPNIFHSVHGQV